MPYYSDRQGFPVRHRFADGDVACICQLLGEKILGGTHQRLTDPSGQHLRYEKPEQLLSWVHYDLNH